MLVLPCSKVSMATFADCSVVGAAGDERGEWIGREMSAYVHAQQSVT